MITNSEYMQFVLSNYYTKFEPRIVYIALGLAGESGEAVDAVKKLIRDGNIKHETIALELGDVLYYTTALANELGYTIEDIMQMNKEKLEHRNKFGRAHG